MPVVTFDYHDFLNLLGYEISKEELLDKLPMIGGDLDRVEGDEISIEFFPNRPDLSSVEGIARASRAFFGFKLGLTKYPVEETDIVMNVDPSVNQVRPYVACALVTGITMSDELISSLMGLQERLHLGIGRNRRRVAIGVHNYDAVQPPFTYKTVDPDAVQFIPLAKDEPMTLREILYKHEKGIAYAHILKDVDRYPLIVDRNNNVLSFPPIINGILTEVTPYTRNIFLDVTGMNLQAVKCTLNIVATALAERGGKIHSVNIKYSDHTEVTPDLTPIRRELSIPYVNRILGLSLSREQIMESLMKMEYNVNIVNDETIEVEIPSWRADILHDIDLVEDVAIGYGYEKFDGRLPEKLTFGKPIESHEKINSLRTIMIGLGFQEVTTFTISNENDEFRKLSLPVGKKVDILNPIGEEYSSLRVSLLPSLLKLLAENKHHPLPQRIFEIGIIVDEDFKNKRHLSAVEISAKAGFTNCKSIIEAVIRNIGIKYELAEKDHPAFISGRCASVIYREEELGFFGELHPKTIVNYGLEHPIIAFEFQLDKLLK